MRHVHLGHGPGLYALAGSEREYLVCERCDEVRTVPADDLDVIRDRIRTRFGYEARFTHFPILGLCARCAAASHDHRGAPMAHDKDPHEHPHTHEHEHEHRHDDRVHEHPHATHDHEHTEHEHEHRHDDEVHSHPHVHEKGLEDEHAHEH